MPDLRIPEPQSIDGYGHISSTVYMRDGIQFHVDRSVSVVTGKDRVSLHVDGSGGNVSITLSPQQWQKIVAAVAAVLPRPEAVAE